MPPFMLIDVGDDLVPPTLAIHDFVEEVAVDFGIVCWPPTHAFWKANHADEAENQCNYHDYHNDNHDY